MGNSRSPIAEMSAASRTLIAFLEKTCLAPDFDREKVFTYQEMMREAGVAKMDRLRGPLNTARSYMLRQNSLLLVTIPGVGVKAATDTEAADDIGRALGHIRRKGRRAQRKAVVVQIDKLPQSRRSTFLADQAQFAVVVEATSRPLNLRLTQKATETQQKLALSTTIAFLAGSGE